MATVRIYFGRGLTSFTVKYGSTYETYYSTSDSKVKSVDLDGEGIYYKYAEISTTASYIYVTNFTTSNSSFAGLKAGNAAANSGNIYTDYWWMYYQDGSSDDTSITVRNRTITLYCDYVTQIVWYNLTYKMNDGTDANYGNIETHTSVTSVAVKSGPTRTGYTFVNWNTQSNGTGTSYAYGSNITLTSNTTLYAQWIRKYSVHYKLYSSDASDWSSSSGWTGGSQYTITTTEPSNQTAGSTTYKFMGWSTSSTATTVNYAPGDTIIINDDIYLYAVWKRQGTITYYVDGSQWKQYIGYAGKNYYIISDQPTKSGYRFDGWATSSGGAVAYTSGSVFTMPAYDISLYAVFKRQGTITYYVDSTQWKQESGYEGTNYYITSDEPRVRDGTYFAGWATSSGGSVAYTSGSVFTMPNYDISFYAVTPNIPKYRITYYSDEQIVEQDTASYASVHHTITSTIPTKSGYTFKGWATSRTGAVVYVAGNTLTISEDLSLYAVWKKLSDVIYRGSSGGIVRTISNCEEGTYQSIIDLIPTKAGHEFMGWSSNYSGHSGSIFNYGDGFSMPATAITFTPIYDFIPVPLFYWKGSNDADGNYFKSGVDVSSAITASAWTRMLQKAKYIYDITKDSNSDSISVINTGDNITADLFNSTRAIIGSLDNAGVMVDTQRIGNKLYPGLFNGTNNSKNSLKKALNNAISYYNSNGGQ